MACPGGTSSVGVAYGTDFCTPNGYCTWVPWDNKSSRVQHVYDVCRDSSGNTSQYYTRTDDLGCC
ncbi:hypothetical protein PAXY110619_21650 [Paenibacillus xylanexedens]|uniref:Uncharacterized protein n=1 Tax=Paenibacillus xylanexedens TaxID=528191 RepID=A0ABS4RX50_PAEXY|nr:hypothetical protein [Paenibacillus xylanexedens]